MISATSLGSILMGQQEQQPETQNPGYAMVMIPFSEIAMFLKVLEIVKSGKAQDTGPSLFGMRAGDSFGAPTTMADAMSGVNLG